MASEDPRKQTPGQLLDEENVDLAGEGEQSVDEFAQVLAERDEYLDQLQRSRAEFINFKRRNDQERVVLRQIVTRDVVAAVLPVVDDLNRAIDAIPEPDRETGWVKGVEMIQAKLATTFERLGITKVDSLGQPFDPTIHEAIGVQPDSSGTTVVQVYQDGYRLGDLLVRPAMVVTGDAEDAAEAMNA